MRVFLFGHFTFVNSQLKSLEMLLVFRANSPPYPAGLGKGATTGPLKKQDMQVEKSCLVSLLLFSKGENKCGKKGILVDIIYLDL